MRKNLIEFCKHEEKKNVTSREIKNLDPKPEKPKSREVYKM